MDPIQTITTAARVLCTGRTGLGRSAGNKTKLARQPTVFMHLRGIYSPRKMHFVRDSL